MTFGCLRRSFDVRREGPSVRTQAVERRTISGARPNDERQDLEQTHPTRIELAATPLRRSKREALKSRVPSRSRANGVVAYMRYAPRTDRLYRFSVCRLQMTFDLTTNKMKPLSPTDDNNNKYTREVA